MAESPGENAASDEDIDELLASYPPQVRELALKARELVREIVPDAVEEIDRSAKLVGYSFIPGTYKGMIVAIAPQTGYVNIMFAKGAELLEQGLDDEQLLEGTGKKARHIKVRSQAILNDAATRRLIEAAVERTPRG